MYASETHYENNFYCHVKFDWPEKVEPIQTGDKAYEQVRHLNLLLSRLTRDKCNIFHNPIAVWFI